MSIGTFEGMTSVTAQTAQVNPVNPAHVLLIPGAIELALVIMDCREEWAELTSHQRAALLHPDMPVHKRTSASLIRRGLWAVGGPTPWGVQVARYGNAEVGS